MGIPHTSPRIYTSPFPFLYNRGGFETLLFPFVISQVKKLRSKVSDWLRATERANGTCKLSGANTPFTKILRTGRNPVTVSLPGIM